METTAKIAVVLDRSGSMQRIRDATIAGFNEFVAGQRLAQGKATLLLAQFDHEYQVDYDKPVADVPDLNADTYVPRGNTALLDAIGRTINELGASLSAMREADRPSKVVVVIITDGEENASREFERDKICEMVTHQREVYQWEFIFLGANLDAFSEGPKLGILAAASMQYSADPLGAIAMFSAGGEATLQSRKGKPVTFSPDQRAAAMGKPKRVRP
jgi:hypothetical protein